MQYPLISEYVAAIRDAKENLDELAYLEPVFDNHGEPYRSSGAFAVVFKMKDPKTGRNYALKCFTDEQEGLSADSRGTGICRLNIYHGGEVSGAGAVCRQQLQ